MHAFHFKTHHKLYSNIFFFFLSHDENQQIFGPIGDEVWENVISVVMNQCRHSRHVPGLRQTWSRAGGRRPEPKVSMIIHRQSGLYSGRLTVFFPKSTVFLKFFYKQVWMTALKCHKQKYFINKFYIWKCLFLLQSVSAVGIKIKTKVTVLK